MKINSFLAFLFLFTQAVVPVAPMQTRLNQPGRATTIQAPILKWEHGGCNGIYCETGWYSSPAVADLDKDGSIEVIGGAYSLFILNGVDGSTINKIDSTNNRIWPGVVVADLQPDGELEIVTAKSGGFLTVYDHHGNILWTKTVPPGNELRSLAVADLDGDGSLEIITASTASSSQWYVFEPDGTVRPSAWPQLNSKTDPDGYAAGCYNENIAAGDLNGDGRGEIIGPNDTHYIDAFLDDGSQLRASDIFGKRPDGTNKYWSQVGVQVDQEADLRGYAYCGLEHRPNFADSAPIIVDLNGDGILETVVVGNVYNCGTDPYTDLYQMPFIFTADRTRWKAGGFDWTVIPTPDSGAAPKSEDWNKIEMDEPNPVAADLDGDGNKEILYASYDGRMHAYWLDKTEHGNWPYSVSRPSEGFIRFASEPAVADLDGDGKGEVIFASWAQKGSQHTGKLYILDYLGNPLQIVDLPPVGEADWNGALAAPTLADIDGDHELEVVLNTANSGLVAYDLPGSRTDGILWGTGRGSYLRSGALTPSSLSGSRTWVRPILPVPGDTLTYTISLRNPGVLLPGVTLTDTLSTGQAIQGTIDASSGEVSSSGSSIYWKGRVTTVPITITFNTLVDPLITGAKPLTSNLLINNGHGTLTQRQTGVVVNGLQFYLPVINR
jgi:uncharacterized repeat protein (TIGR01451 family)